MKSLPQLGDMYARVEISKSANEFGQLVKFILAHRGKFSQASFAAEQKNLNDIRGLTTRTIGILKASGGLQKISPAQLEQKAAQSPHSLAGSAFQDAAIIASGFAASLVSAGAFDGMLSSMVPIPLQSGTIGAVTTSATAYSVSEASLKPISRLSLTGAQRDPQKVHVAIVVTQELARSPLLAAGQLIQRQLRNAVALRTDQEFLANITVGVTPVTSAGITGNAVRADIEYLLRQVPLGANSKPFIITTAAICETWSMINSSGISVFPDLTPLGGSINGIPVLVSDGVTAGLVILADASQIAAASGDIVLSEIDEMIVQLDDAPTSPPTTAAVYQSLWQNNDVGIRLERYFIGQKLSPNAVAVIQNSGNYSTGNSPP
jgi:hypothetical protein